MVSFQDEVKHVSSDAMGTVIAIYVVDEKTYVDVRSAEFDRVYYKSPVENWQVVRTQEEIEGTTD